MKTNYFFSVLMVALLLPFIAMAQRQVIFTESFGEAAVEPYPTPDNWTELHTPGVVLTSGGCTDMPDIRPTISSAAATKPTYPEASGNNNVYFQAEEPGITRGFAMEGINVAYYKDVEMVFGYSKTGDDMKSELEVSYWNGSDWVEMEFEFNEGVGDPSGWYRSPIFALPEDADLANLGFKFVKPASYDSSIRIDDVWLTGIPTIHAAPVIITPGQLENGFIAQWQPYEGATGYILDVSESPTFETADEDDVVIGWTFATKPNNPIQSEEELLADVYSANNEGTYLQTNATFNEANPAPYGVGAGSASNPNAISVTGWHDGAYKKHFLIEVDASGFSSLNVSSWNYSSANGPRNMVLQYRFGEDGEWVTIPDSELEMAVASYGESSTLVDLPIPSAVDNQNNLNLRWVVSSTLRTEVKSAYIVTSGGTSRITNVFIRGKKADLVEGYNNLLVTGTSQEVSGLEAGKSYYYRVRATDGVNISLASTPDQVSTGIATHFSNQNTKAYYNQANNSFEIKAPGNVGNMDVQIMDISGRLIKQSHILGNIGSIDAHNLPAGAYMICVNINGSLINFKTIK